MMKTTHANICAALVILCLAGFSTSLTAQQNPKGSITEQFRRGLIDFSKEMNRITEGIESVEDAEKAEPRIAATLDKLASIVVGLVNNFGSLTKEQGVEIANLDALIADPEVKKWSDKVQASMLALNEEHPEAAAKLQEIGSRHGQKFMEAMAQIQAKIQGHMEASSKVDKSE